MEQGSCFKTIEYNVDNVFKISFQIPEDWVEDYEDIETGMYYPESDQGKGPWPIGGVLYLMLATNENPDGWTNLSVEDFIKSSLDNSDSFSKVRDNVWSIRSKNYEKEESHRAVNHYWKLFSILDSNTLGIAIFLFSAIDIFYDKPGDLYYDKVEMLDKELTKTVFFY